MQEANDNTVLGNFDNAIFRYYGITSTFYKRNGKFFVRTDGPDGTLQEYEIAYTYGVRLVRFEAARSLAPAPNFILSPAQISVLDSAVDDYIRAKGGR